MLPTKTQFPTPSQRMFSEGPPPVFLRFRDIDSSRSPADKFVDYEEN